VGAVVRFVIPAALVAPLPAPLSLAAFCVGLIKGQEGTWSGEGDAEQKLRYAPPGAEAAEGARKGVEA
jgi:hypothetical protein